MRIQALFFPGIVAALSLSCASVKDVSTRLDSWHGAELADLTRLWGEPTQITEGKDGGKTLHYDVVGDHVLKHKGRDGNDDKKTCLIIVKADAKGRITDQSWDGHRRTCVKFIIPKLWEGEGFAEDRCEKVDTRFYEVPRLRCKVEGKTCEFERDKRLNPATDCQG